jgi:uncharacterized protein
MKQPFSSARSAAILAALLVASPVLASGPSYDCKRASNTVERIVCKDEALSALDRTLADAYANASKKLPPAGASEQRTVQRRWIRQRNHCAKQKDTRACVETAYRTRTIELRILSGELTGPAAISYKCEGHESLPVFASFYQTDPPAAVVTIGNDQFTAFSASTGSGAKYVADGVEFWEHHGDALITWKGKDMKCVGK